MNTPRAAYLHVPFCRRRCGYCNFTVITGREDLFKPLLDAVQLEIGRGFRNQTVDTLYLGGGTPTHLPPHLLERLCNLLMDERPIAPGGEWTVEANPEDVDLEKIAVLTHAGVTRVSLGVQSFRPAKLRMLERNHTAEETYRATAALQDAGFQVAIDLIFGAPNETYLDWLSDLDDAVSLRPQHISTYGLTFERGTTFWSRRRRGQLLEVEESLQRDMYLTAIDALQSAGYEHYEVSNFALSGHRSRHNETYWSGNEYLAEGPGAARYVAGVRELNHRSTTAYLKRVFAGQSPVMEREQLDNECRARESLVLGLRRLEGVDRQLFRDRTGYDVDALAGPAIVRFVESGWLTDDGKQIRLTRDGLLISDALWPDLL